jgi:hypothetical protein
LASGLLHASWKQWKSGDPSFRRHLGGNERNEQRSKTTQRERKTISTPTPLTSPPAVRAMPPLHDAAAAIGRRGLRALHRSAPITLPYLSAAFPTIAYIAAKARRFIITRANCECLTQHNSIHQQQTAYRSLSSISSSSSSNKDVTTNLTIGDDEYSGKSMFSKLWDKYSIEGQKKRIILGERLFRSAQHRANDP